MPEAAQVKRLYGFFRKVDGKWVRDYDSLAATKERAVRLFQSALLAGAMNGQSVALRPLPKEKDNASRTRSRVEGCPS